MIDFSKSWRGCFLVLFVLMLGVPNPSLSFFFGGATELVNVNGMTYSDEDYAAWWKEWREAGDVVPESADEFIDWMLLFQEAESMQLYDHPAYRKKVSVFLKVRALMLLKYHEVDKKIGTPSEGALWQIYQAEYTPRVALRMIFLPTEEEARAVAEKLGEAADLEEGGRQAGIELSAQNLMETKPIKLKDLPEPLQVALGDTEEGAVGGPFFWEKGWYLYEVLSFDEGSEDEFVQLKERLVHKWTKAEQGRLTSALVERLKKKYDVVVNEEVFPVLTQERLPEEYASTPLITIGELTVDARTVFNKAQQEHKLRRGGRNGTGEDFSVTVRRVVNGIITQTLTAQEALERHFEREEPLKSTYEFYCQRRMIKELENELIWPKVSVGEADLRVYYEENRDEFARGEVAELAMVQTIEEDLAQTLEAKLKVGEDFFHVLRPLAPAGIKAKTIPLAHLSPEVREVVNSLSPGQVSSAIHSGADIYFVKLLSAPKKEYQPFEMVEKDIYEKVRKEQFSNFRNALIQKLRVRSDISLDQTAWQELRQRLLGSENGEF